MSIYRHAWNCLHCFMKREIHARSDIPLYIQSYKKQINFRSTNVNFRHAWNCLHCFMKREIYARSDSPLYIQSYKKVNLVSSKTLRPVTVLIWKNVWQVVTRVLGISKCSCWPNTQNIWVKTLISYSICTNIA